MLSAERNPRHWRGKLMPGDIFFPTKIEMQTAAA
jgi:hypothetical protein